MLTLLLLLSQANIELLVAARRGSVPAAQAALAKGADPNSKEALVRIVSFFPLLQKQHLFAERYPRAVFTQQRNEAILF